MHQRLAKYLRKTQIGKLLLEPEPLKESWPQLEALLYGIQATRCQCESDIYAQQSFAE